VGNPVRAEIAAVPPPAERAHGRTRGPLRLLVVGGSLGAAALNETVPQALLRLIPAEQRPVVVHQAGESIGAAARANYARAQVARELRALHRRHGGAYEWADLVICRAGRADRGRARGGRGGQHPGAVPARGGRPPDRQRALPGDRRRRDPAAATELTPEGSACSRT
jgi:hypothetical protein